jgi:hypothetical protein
MRPIPRTSGLSQADELIEDPEFELEFRTAFESAPAICCLPMERCRRIRRGNIYLYSAAL